MTKSQKAIRKVVYPVVARAAGTDERDLKDSDDLIKDLAMDSLSVLEIAVDLESHYDVRIEDEDLDDIQTVGEIITYIERRLGED